MSYETVFPKPACMNTKEAVPSFMERVLNLHTVTWATKDMAGTVVAESDFDPTEHKSQLLQKSVVMLSSDSRNEIDRVLEDLSVVTITSVEAIAETSLTKWMSTLQLQIVKSAVSTFEDALQASYFNSDYGLKTVILIVVERALGEVVQCGRVPSVSVVQMRDLLKLRR